MMSQDRQIPFVVEIEREMRYISSLIKQRGREILS